MTSALRVALTVIWEVGERPAFVRAKLRDVAALGVLATLVLAGFALSLLTQVAIQAGVHATDALGLAEAGAVVSVAVELLASGAATFAALLAVYGLAAPERVPFAALWPSALVTALAIDAGVAGYAFYLVRIASFSSIYGPLGAVLRVPGAALRGRRARPVRSGAGQSDRGPPAARSRPERVMRARSRPDTNAR